MTDFDIGGEKAPAETDIQESGRRLEYFDHIKKVNDLFYDQIKLSDQKAAYIFTFMLAFLVTSTEAKGVFNWTHYSHENIGSAICSALLAGSSTFSIVCAIFTVLPRRIKNSTSLFWGAWPAHRDAFATAAREGNVEYLFRQYLDNADILSSIARSKFRCITLAFWGLMATVLSYIFSMVFF